MNCLDDIEKELGIATCPVNWPIGSGKDFKGVYDRNEKESRVVLRYQKGNNTGKRAARSAWTIRRWRRLLERRRRWNSLLEEIELHGRSRRRV